MKDIYNNLKPRLILALGLASCCKALDTEPIWADVNISFSVIFATLSEARFLNFLSDTCIIDIKLGSLLC